MITKPNVPKSLPGSAVSVDAEAGGELPTS